MNPRQATPEPLLSSSPLQPAPHVQHKYGTRKRQNSTMRPSVRLRDCDSPISHVAPLQPRRIKPLGSVTPNAHTPPFLRAKCSKDRAHEMDKEGNQKTRAREIDFPPKHVVLHPDDASSKVFVAIGKALLSVNNCAMTVKDLAELSLKFGLACQNVSAAAQAITSFIRSHLQRCEVEEDFPLLLRHSLSGTSRDDSLAPALYSRAGGNVGKEKAKDKHPASDVEIASLDGAHRLTCFRRGTTVWYLSKVAGAACPFARCGIALRDYADVPATLEKKQGPSNTLHSLKSPFACRPGVKRKRGEGLRGTAPGHVSSGSEHGSDAATRRPAKVMLTLKLKPCLSSLRSRDSDGSSSESASDSDSQSEDEDEEDEVMSPDPSATSRPSTPANHQPCERESDWSLPPYPIQRRISIPPYTPSEHSFPAYPMFTPHTPGPTPYWATYYVVSSPPAFGRSSSVPLSVGSPPPDSEDEDEDFHISMTRDPELEFEHERDMEWEVSTAETEGTRSPERDYGHTLFSPVIVKAEDDFNGGLRGMLDSWENMDFPSAGASVKRETDEDKEKLRRTRAPVKLEELDVDAFAFDAATPESIDDVWHSDSPELLHIKQEDDVEELHLYSDMETFAPITESTVEMQPPVSSNTYERPTGLVWKDVELFGPDSVNFEESEWEGVTQTTEQPRATALTLPMLSSSADSVSSVSESPIPRSSPEGNWIPISPGVHDFDDSVEVDSTHRPPSPSTSDVPTPAHMRKPLPIRPAITVVSDIPVTRDEVSTPWERGMISHYRDVEDHLPACTPFPFAVAFDCLAASTRGLPGDQCEDPLSPIEEEMFRTLCLTSDWEPEATKGSIPPADDQSVDLLGPAGEEVEVDHAEVVSEENARPQRGPLRRSRRVAQLNAVAAQPQRTPRTRTALRKRTSAS